jgi:hypothetical protein
VTAAQQQTTVITPYWDDDPELWDQISIAGTVLPGKADADGSVGRKLDTRKPHGADGATIVDKGMDLAEVRITVYVWEPAHLEAWEKLLPTILPRQKLSDRTAVAVYHPSLAELGITRVQIKKVGALRESSPTMKAATIEAIEFRPIQRRNVTHAVQPPSGQEDPNGPKSRTDRSPAATGASNP